MRMRAPSLIPLLPLLLSTLSSIVNAAELPQSTPSATPDSDKVNVDAIKERYWARGDESELGVVQNRAYSKEHKMEFKLFGGVTETDPFLSVKTLGISAGFHFTEYVAFHALFIKDFVSPSNALLTFQDKLKATTEYNQPKNFFGTEAAASILYGKLSLLGKAIIYYDLHLSGGLGLSGTESGTYFTQVIGIGQQIYLGKSFSLLIDYRLMHYKEELLERVVPTRLGQSLGKRDNWSNAITIGIGFLLEVKK